MITDDDDSLRFLAGTWSTHRRLLDRAGGMTGVFTGTTSFTPDGEGLRWDEEGTVSWPHFEGRALRTYLVRVSAPGVMEIRFPDGRLLCTLDLRSGLARDEHTCFPDTYRVDFAIRSLSRIEYCWEVTGPLKDLLLTTELTRH